MGFFNKKEEILEMQLTDHGKTLLEQGRLKPAYYAFFDDDILYDTACAGFEEEQNKAARRIKYDTPSFKVQANTLGAETRVTQFLAAATASADFSTVTENSVQFIQSFQDTPIEAQKFYLGPDPLGNSSLRTSYAPAWHLNFLANEVVTSQNYVAVNLTSSQTSLADGFVKQIPQLDVEIDYQTFYSTDLGEEEESPDRTVRLTANNDAGVAVYMKENYLVVEVREENTDFLKENFDIEVLELNTDGTYSRKMFLDDNNLMGDSTDQYVEHYMNINVDNEIPPEVVRELGITDSAIRGSTARIQLSRDLYNTDNEEPC